MFIYLFFFGGIFFSYLGDINSSPCKWWTVSPSPIETESQTRFVKREQYLAMTGLGQNNNRLNCSGGSGGGGGAAAQGHPKMRKTDRERARGQGVSGCKGLSVLLSNERANGSAPFTQL